jgi:CheY-like chemotaxis protein
MLNVQVRDTGPGIPQDLLSRVFVPFFQGDSRGGTGLGLSIVSELVGLLDGTVDLSSLVGLGTVVRVALPIDIAPMVADSAAHEGMSKPALRSVGRPSLHPARQVRRVPAISALAHSLSGSVLLVEDNELNAALAARVLDALGLEVTVAGNGQEAVEAVKRFNFHAVLMDCRMPVLDGLEATRRIRAQERRVGSPETPIIGLTANTLDGDRQICLDAGMNDYLGKPYTAAELHSVLVRWLVGEPRQASGRSPEARKALS